MSAAGLPASAARRVWAVLGAITLVALALRTTGLGAQLLIADDGTVGITALNYTDMGWPSPTMWNHPRLRDLLVRASIEAFGTGGPWGLKIWSALLGAASVAAVGALVLATTRSLPAAALAAALLAIDPLHLDFSRQAINDVYTGLFPVASVVALLRYRDSRRVPWLIAAGLLLGLGLASKWNAAFPVAAAGAVVLVAALRDEPSGRGRGAELALFAACLVLLPLAVYVATFTPWFGRGHDLAEWVRLQRRMAFETATHTGYDYTHLPGNPGEIVSAVRWFTTPVWYVDYVHPSAATAGAGVFISGVANAIACLSVLPAAALAAWRWWKARETGPGLLLLLFLSAWLPFVLVARPIWTNSAVSVLPWAFALVGWAATHLHVRFPRAVGAWAAAALLFAVPLWPPAMGISLPPSDAVLRAVVAPAALDPATHP